MSRRNLLILLAALAVSYLCHARAEQNSYARYIADGLDTIASNSLEPVPSQELFTGAMNGMVGVLRRHGDPHSQFLPEDEAEPLRAEIHQQFGGVGVHLGRIGDPPRLAIMGPPNPGGPAARQKLQAGDLIRAIDERPTEKMSLPDALRLMRGRPGTKLRLTIQRGAQSQPRVVELVREVIHIESVVGDRRQPNATWEFRLESEPRVAQVRITSFGDRTAAELTRTLADVQAAGAEGVVLDLRDNAGGALEAAVAVCEQLLPTGQLIVETRGRDHELLTRYKTTSSGRFVDLPLAVLVNRNSASAAEIVAACLQDHGRAPIFGERSYGKGTVQQLVPLESGRSLLKLTWASFWRPSGAPINRTPDENDNSVWGIKPAPENELRLSDDEYESYRKYRADRDSPSTTGLQHPPSNFRDEQLQMAVAYLRGQMNQNK